MWNRDIFHLLVRIKRTGMGCDIYRLQKRIFVNKRSFRFDHARKNQKLQATISTIKESA